MRRTLARLFSAFVLLAALQSPTFAGPKATKDKEPSLGPAVKKPVDVLIVDGEPGEKELESETYFLRTLLGVTVRLGGKVSFQVVNTNLPAAFTCKLIILANVENVGTKGAALLEKHVKNGGGLLIFCGDHVDIGKYNSLLHKQEKGLLPGRLTKTVGTADDKAAVRRLEPDSCNLGGGDPPDRLADRLLNGVAVTRYIKVAPSKRAAVELKYDNGAPVILSQTFGKGRSVLVTTSCDREWSNLPTQPIYLLLVLKMLEDFGIRVHWPMAQGGKL